MYPTAEVRWFQQGRIPAGVETWFQHRAGSLERQSPRTDHYLRLPDNEDLNVKLREGRMEVKQRFGSIDIVQFHNRVTGVVEQWRKWSFKLAEPGIARLRAVSRTSSWIGVRKDRRLRTYWVKDGKDVAAGSRPETHTQGCELELARVHASGQSWWTLAFEAFGDESILRDGLLLVAQQVFKADQPPPLQAIDSRSYAAWLAGLARLEARRRWQS